MARRRNEEKRAFWKLAIQMQRQSGLSIAKFCNREGLKEATFFAWRRRLTTEEAADEVESNSRPEPARQLVPVQVVVDTGLQPIEVVSPTGFLLRVGNESGTENVRRVLHLLHEMQ